MGIASGNVRYGSYLAGRASISDIGLEIKAFDLAAGSDIRLSRAVVRALGLMQTPEADRPYLCCNSTFATDGVG